MPPIDRDYEELRDYHRIVLFLREGKKSRYHVRLKVPNVAGHKFASYMLKVCQNYFDCLTQPKPHLLLYLSYLFLTISDVL